MKEIIMNAATTKRIPRNSGDRLARQTQSRARRFNRRVFHIVLDTPAGREARVRYYNIIVADDHEDAIKRAVVKGVIPSHTVMQYYVAIEVTKTEKSLPKH